MAYDQYLNMIWGDVEEILLPKEGNEKNMQRDVKIEQDGIFQGCLSEATVLC